MTTPTPQTPHTATTGLATLAHDPAVRLINVFFTYLLLIAVLLFSNTELETWAVLLISAPTAGILTVIERWLYNDLFVPKP